MRLVVLGGSGFIGRNLLEVLAEGSHPFSLVAAVHRQGRSFEGWVSDLGIHPIQCDLLSERRSWSAYDVAINLAGNSDHGLAIQDPDADLAMNAGILLSFLQGFEGRVVSLGSAAVYFGLEGFVGPASRLHPTFGYGISKLAAEHYVAAFRHLGRLSSYALFRLFYALGKYDKPRRLIPQLVSSVLLQGQSEFSIRGTGSSYLDPLDAAYVARSLLTAAASDVSGVFDLCGGRNRTVSESVREAASALGCKVNVHCDGEPEMYPVRFFGSLDQARREFALPPPPSFEESVRDFSEWFLCSRSGEHDDAKG
jgi:nucleoside-diphosphate-sugar epimerase